MATQLQCEESMNFQHTCQASVALFSWYLPVGSSFVIITCFLEGCDPNTKEVKMQVFDDFDLVKFQCAMVDIRVTLHFPTKGTPLILKKEVILDMISTEDEKVQGP